MFTTGYELMTSLTNILIFIVSIVCVFSKRKISKLWKYFFTCLLIDSLLGSIIHGIVMNNCIKNVLWICLSMVFCITINILLTIFLKVIKKNIKDNIIIYLSLFIYLIIIIEFIIGIDFLNTFIAYACISLLLIFIICIDEYINKKSLKYECFLYACVFQIIGGLFLINKSYCFNELMLDKNGIYHLFMICSEIFFYKGAVNK